jgi:hypothetical protein
MRPTGSDCRHEGASSVRSKEGDRSSRPVAAEQSIAGGPTASPRERAGARRVQTRSKFRVLNPKFPVRFTESPANQLFPAECRRPFRDLSFGVCSCGFLDVCLIISPSIGNRPYRCWWILRPVQLCWAAKMALAVCAKSVLWVVPPSARTVPMVRRISGAKARAMRSH